MHISELIEKTLISDGWIKRPDTIEYQKIIPKFEEAGTVSDGSRIVRLVVDPTGRWLERLDGWGIVVKDIDLRNYNNDPQRAINDVLR